MKENKLFLIPFCLFFMVSILRTAAAGQELQNRQRVRKNITTLRLLRMTEALNLTEEQTTKIYPFISRVEEEKMDIQKQIGIKMQELKSTLREQAPKEEEIADKVKSIKDLRRLLKEKDDEIENFLENNLTAIQKAKYLLFSVEFSRDLGEKLNRARMLRRELPRKK
jgi:Spy/CpxP family protein refolding chaperone